MSPHLPDVDILSKNTSLLTGSENKPVVEDLLFEF